MKLPRHVAMRMGTVEALDGRMLRVAVDGEAGSREARRAVSCLLEPKVGDRVALASFDVGATDPRARSVDDRVFVLHVVARGEEGRGAGVLSADGDVDVKLENGAFRVEAENVDVASAAGTRLRGERIEARATQALFSAARAGLVGRVLRTRLDRLEVVAGEVERVAERALLRAKEIVRTVTEVDELRAGKIDYEVEREATIEAGDATITGEKLVKGDAKQVQVG